MNIGFEYPWLILFSLLGLILYCGLSRLFRDRYTVRIPLGPPGGTPFKPPAKLGWFIRLLQGMDLTGLFLLGIAAAGPLRISTERVWLNRGADIIFVVDVSPSMAARDMENQNRFDTARDLVRSFALSRPSDALGLVAVGNDAALLLPPTIDRRSLFSRLETLHIGELGDGTALGMGLAIAALHLKDSSAPRRSVVLITDGENNAGALHPETAAALLPELGAGLWIIGVGSGGEVPIDYVDPLTKIRRSGTFDSRFDPETLKAIARKGEGSYIPAPSAQSFAHAFSRIHEGELIIGRSGTLVRTQGIQGTCIIPALLILGLRGLIRRYGGRALV
ncbi:MAG: VWA domain-containing protein [Treponema sp.]|jgi:Ca-activated chloride channel family protein|nr:VWA domain-containing protein [Treponema sp.]